MTPIYELFFINASLGAGLHGILYQYQYISLAGPKAGLKRGEGSATGGIV